MAGTIEEAGLIEGRVNETLDLMGLGQLGVICAVSSVARASGTMDYIPRVTLYSHEEIDVLVMQARDQGLLRGLMGAEAFLPNSDGGGLSLRFVDLI